MAGIWEKLTTLSFLTWLGWAASIILVFGFIIGLILQFSSKKFIGKYSDKEGL